jgi:hypothetical protein
VDIPYEPVPMRGSIGCAVAMLTVLGIPMFAVIYLAEAAGLSGVWAAWIGFGTYIAGLLIAALLIRGLKTPGAR